ncbi:MAG: peptide deformylase [Gaiellales bacterium]|jgi:peptide deformylase|nr:peptide deformylase [Gaiellales bacterium]
MSEQAEELEQEQADPGPSPEERREWRATALRLVRQYPDPALRNAASPVADVDEEVRRLAARMVDVMDRAHGVGLAAPQLGVLRRMLVYRVGEEDAIRVLINPSLSELSEETVVSTEGCLSLLGGELQVPVSRHVRVHVSAVDSDGDPVELEAEGFEARVIQHEIDHLDGVLIVDRAQDEQRREALRELRLRAG